MVSAQNVHCSNPLPAEFDPAAQQDFAFPAPSVRLLVAVPAWGRWQPEHSPSAYTRQTVPPPWVKSAAAITCGELRSADDVRIRGLLIVKRQRADRIGADDLRLGRQRPDQHLAKADQVIAEERRGRRAVAPTRSPSRSSVSTSPRWIDRSAAHSSRNLACGCPETDAATTAAPNSDADHFGQPRPDSRQTEPGGLAAQTAAYPPRDRNCGSSPAGGRSSRPEAPPDPGRSAPASDRPR